MKVVISFPVEVDPTEWAATYGLAGASRRAVLDDAEEYLTRLAQQRISEANLPVIRVGDPE